jgi:hypothetical protein
MTTAGDTKALIEQAISRFLEEVPSLAPLKLVIGLELRARHDTQIYRVELPGPKVSKDLPSDAKVTLEVNRPRFNELATAGTVKQWRDAFEHGDARATGIDQYLKLIKQVVDKHDERAGLRRAKQH